MEEILKTSKRTWRRLGVPRRIAADMSTELQADLGAASAEGVAPSSFVGGDVRQFATAWAEARGVIKVHPHLGSTVLAAIVGAIPGVGFALFVAYGLSSTAVAEILGSGVIRVGENAYEPYLELPEWLLAALFGLGALFAYMGAVASADIYLHWRRDPAAASTTRTLVLALPLATGAAIGAAVLFASTRDFSTDLGTVVADGVVATAVFAFGVLAARLWAVRRAPSRTRSVAGAAP